MANNPVAVVTGASRGIGKQLCLDLAKAGYDVVAVARSSAANPRKLPGTIDETADLARSAGTAILPVELDVRDEDGVRALADRVYAAFGRCDLVVNNAAVAPPGNALDHPPKLWRQAFEVNVHGPFYLTYYFAPRMTEGAAHVVNISSASARQPEFDRPSYTASKLALEGMTEVLAWQTRGRVAMNALRIDIRVFSEGFAYTLGGMDFSQFEDPAVISDAVLWLARQPVSFTGNVLEVHHLRSMGAVRPFAPMGERANEAAREVV